MNSKPSKIFELLLMEGKKQIQLLKIMEIFRNLIMGIIIIIICKEILVIII